MIFVRRVSGKSMEPGLSHGQIIIFLTRAHISAGSVVVAQMHGREIVKRVHNVDETSLWLYGDNADHSTDSRHYGSVPKSAILGSMVFAFPPSQPAPKPRTGYGVQLGWIAAAIMIIFSVMHLFRIDTFVPELSKVFGDNHTLTAWVASCLVCAEVFSIPFLLRMRLSVLARYLSGVFSVLAPLFWLLVAIWTFGTTIAMPQLGEFKELPSSWLLIVANVVWVVLAYVTLWSLGYDRRPHERQTVVTRFLSRLSK